MLPMLATNGASMDLHKRALDALRQRQDFQTKQNAAQGQLVTPFNQLEQPDPNFGMMNDVAQGLAETGSSRVRFPGTQTSDTETAWGTNPANFAGPTAAQAAMNALVKQKYPGAGV